MKTENGLRIVESGDQFFDEVYYIWRPVPVHWHGDTVERLDFSIRANPFANPQPVQTNPKNQWKRKQTCRLSRRK